MEIKMKCKNRVFVLHRNIFIYGLLYTWKHIILHNKITMII